MRNNHLRSIIAALFCWLLLQSVVRAQQRPALPQDTVARVGVSVVTAQELMERVELMPWPVRVRPSQLDSMKTQALAALIAEKLLANESRRLGLTEDSVTRRMRRGLENTLVRDELYRREVKGKAAPTEDQVFQGMRRFENDLQVVAFLVRSKKDGELLAGELLAVHSPDTLLRAIPHNLLLDVDTLKVSFGGPDTVFENAAYGIRKSRVSQPVFSPTIGWAVLYLLDRHPNPVAEKLSMDERRHRVDRLLRSRIENDESERLYFGYLSTKHAQGDSTVFNLLADAVSALWKEDTLRYRRLGGFFLTSDMVDILLERLQDHLAAPLVHMEGGDLRLDDALEMMRYDFLVSPALEGESMKGRLNEEVKRLAAGELLARKGRQEYLHNSAPVQRDLGVWNDFWAARSLFYHIRDTVRVTSDDLLQYLLRYKEIFGPRYQVNVREILTDSLAAMSRVLAELAEGRPMAEVAERLSIRREWAVRGGESGYFPVILHPEIGFRSLDADTGAMLGPIRISEGYSLFRVLGKRTSNRGAADFDTLKQKIQERLLKEKRKQVIDAFIAGLARDERVAINEARLKQVRITPVPMFTRRYIGFGGMMNPVPILMPLWDWIKEYRPSIDILL